MSSRFRLRFFGQTTMAVRFTPKESRATSATLGSMSSRIHARLCIAKCELRSWQWSPALQVHFSRGICKCCA